MSNTITVDMENLTQEEREQLINLIEKSNKPKNRWRAEKDKIYYFVDSGLTVVSDIDNNFVTDNKRYKIGNYFKTRKEAEFEKEKCSVYQELKNYAIEHNEGEIDWNNAKQNKYYIYCYDRDIYVNNNHTVMNLGQIYFTSNEIANNAINTVGEDRIKKYLFGINI